MRLGYSVAVALVLAAVLVGCETVPRHDFAKGQRFETTRELGAQIVLLYTDARRGDPIDVLLPEGLVFVVGGELAPGSTALPCLPEAYRGFESRYVSERLRRRPGYRGFVVEFQIEAIEVGARRLAAEGS